MNGKALPPLWAMGLCLSILLCTSANAEDATLWYTEGISLHQSGDFQPAINRFARAERSARSGGNPSLAADAALRISDCYRALGNTLEFRRRAEDVLRKYPEQRAACARAMLRVGEDLWRSGNTGAAREILSRIGRRYPQAREAIALARIQMIQIDLAGGQADDALAEAQSLLAEAAGSEQWYDDVLHYRDQAQVTLAARKAGAAKSRAEGISELELIAGNPDAAPIPRAWASYYLSQAAYWDRGYPGSVAAAEAALAAEGTEGEASLKAWSGLQLAISQAALGDIDAAYKNIIGCDRRHAGFDDAGFQKQLEYRFRQIVDAKRAAGDLPSEPTDPDPILAEGAKAQAEAAFALVYTGDATGAISLLQAVITDYAPQTGAVGWARYRLAEAYYQNRDYANTIATAESLLAEYSPTEYTLLCAWTELMLAAGQLANGEPAAAFDTLQRCRRAYALVEDKGYQNALGVRLSQASNAVRAAKPDQRAAKLVVVNNRWLPRALRRAALSEYADLCASEGDSLAAVRAHIRLRQHYGDDPATLEKANEYLGQVLGEGNVPRQVEILRQAQETTDEAQEKEIVQEEIAYRYLAGGYIDEAVAACHEALRRFGRDARLSPRLAVTQGDAYMKAKKGVRAWCAYLRAVPVPLIHCPATDQLVDKLGWMHRAGWGTDFALQFYDRLRLPDDDAKLFAWKIRARIGSDDIDTVISDTEARLAEATTDEERLPLYWALVWGQLHKKDFASVENTIADMRGLIGDDEQVDAVLMDIVGAHLGPRGEVLLNNIIQFSASQRMKHFATFEMGWCKRYQKDWDGAISWYETAATMPCSRGKCLYGWKGHMEAAAVYQAKGLEFYPHADAHLQDALLLARKHYPEGLAESYFRLAEIREMENELSGAAELYEQAAAAAKGEDQRDVWAEAKIGLGRVHKKQGNPIAAGEALHEVKEKGFHRGHLERAERLLAQVQNQI